MKRKAFIAITFILLTTLLMSACTTAAAIKAEDVMEGITARQVRADADLTGDGRAAVTDFGVELFKRSVDGTENALISPLSVLSAMAMTANGAAGQTRWQMESVFGMSVEELNEYLYCYMQSLPSENKYKLALANSIWIRADERFVVEQSFLQTNSDYFGAAVYKADFDSSTLQDINNWVSGKTDGMIKNILSEIPDETVMYLINALAFDAQWQRVYNDSQVRPGTFTTLGGQAREADMMYSEEHLYLDDGSAVGFIKYYADYKYAFAALLPNEGVALPDYIASLTGEGIIDTLENAEGVKVKTAIPKFESEYGVEMKDVLSAMGMPDAFGSTHADFSALGASEIGNIYISSVIHKTFIAVDEQGTKAGAATKVAAADTLALEDEPKVVYLNRPFVYMIIDCQTNLPIFIGCITDVGE